jgi:hypothetical protein
MSAILGMVVNLVTSDIEDAETDDEIYIGLWGTAGGREFPLSAKDHDDFERGADDLYVLGADPGFGFRRSERAAPGEANDPARVPIDLASVQYVYIRKQAYGQGGDDNAWNLQRVIVLLYDADTLPLPHSRLFFLDVEKGMWFGNEHGHNAWLSESGFSRGRTTRHFLGRLNAKAFA